MKKFACYLSVLLLILALLGFGFFNKTAETNAPVADISQTTANVSNVGKITANVAEISKFGNLILDMSGDDILNRGYEYGDLLEITVADQTIELPLCSNYSDVDTGTTVLRVNPAENSVELAINMGDFATTAGIAEKVNTEEDPGYRWDYMTQVPLQVEIVLKQEAGYLEQWFIHQLIRSDVREDYPHLSDDAYANFRAIATTGIGENLLYRSSSPINPAIGRSTYADSAARNAGIATIINMSDDANIYDGTEGFYYQTCSILYLNLGMDFLSEDSVTRLARGMRFIIDSEPPYLLHCNEGKDRTGFVCALLECLMGATIDEVVDDYMESYVNFYGVEKGSEKYEVVVKDNIIQTLNRNFDISDVYQADLVAEAEAFLTDVLELSADEVSALKTKLGNSQE